MKRGYDAIHSYDLRPLCKCHQEPMHKNGREGVWRCAVKNRQAGLRNARLRHIAVDHGRITYVARAVGVAVKIGHTKNLDNRLEQLRTNCPHEIQLVGTFPKGVRFERKLHIRFAHERIRREWYSESILPEVVDLLREEGSPNLLLVAA